MMPQGADKAMVSMPRPLQSMYEVVIQGSSNRMEQTSVSESGRQLVTVSREMPAWSRNKCPRRSRQEHHRFSFNTTRLDTLDSNMYTIGHGRCE